MTKQNLFELFKTAYNDLDQALHDDPIAVFVNWQAFADSYCKSGEITNRQWATWTTPTPIAKALSRRNK